MRLNRWNKSVSTLLLMILSLFVAGLPAFVYNMVLQRILPMAILFSYPSEIVVFFFIPAIALWTSKRPSWYHSYTAIPLLLMLLGIAFFKPFSHILIRYNWDNNRMAPIAACMVAGLLLFDYFAKHVPDHRNTWSFQKIIIPGIVLILVILFEMMPWMIPMQEPFSPALTSKAVGIFLIAMNYIGIGSLVVLIWWKDQWMSIWMCIICLFLSLLPLFYLLSIWTDIPLKFPDYAVGFVNVTNKYISGLYALLFGMGIQGFISLKGVSLKHYGA